MESIDKIFGQVLAASRTLTGLSNEQIDSLLGALSERVIESKEMLLAANAQDLSLMDKNDPLYDRLELTDRRLEGIASDIKNVSKLESPLGRVLSHRVLPNGLEIEKVSVPFGVIGIVYEARPNVTFDVFSLCLKAGSACILKGGKDADHSNRAIEGLIKGVLRDNGLDENVIGLLPSSHEATHALLHANGVVDLVIPRGSKRLIEYVRQEASVPVIETGAGVCHAYFDEHGDIEKGMRIVNNAKTRRVSVCNALDCLIIHRSRLVDLGMLCSLLKESEVRIYADEESYEALEGRYPVELLYHISGEEAYDTEYMDYAMGIKTVGNVGEALEHIRVHGSGHSECIISEDSAVCERFLKEVDAACVYSNAPTSFTDGAQFGLGAEIGISTQKMHARGPMGLEEITTYKWVIRGEGQVRKV